MAKPELLKIFLHDRGEDVESPWAEDLGPTPGEPDARRVRLVNVPFLHARPTCDDVIDVRPDPQVDGQLAWDRRGVAWSRIESRIAEPGGRWAMIVDYVCTDEDRFEALAKWLWRQQLVPEGCFGPQGSQPGRLYLAVPDAASPAEVMALLDRNRHGFQFVQVHPEPARTKSSTRKPAARTKTSTKKKATPKKQTASQRTSAKQTANNRTATDKKASRKKVTARTAAKAPIRKKAAKASSMKKAAAKRAAKPSGKRTARKPAISASKTAPARRSSTQRR